MGTETRTDPNPGPIDVLMVEDNPGDARLAEEAFAVVDDRVRLSVATDGTTALERLRSAADTPSLILLDLDLPSLDGQTVLRKLKEAPSLRRIPVVVFTTSDDPDDVRTLYETHANAYMTKPQDADQFFETIEHLDAFWFSTAVLPGRCG